MVKPSDYAVKIINRVGDLEDHPQPLSSLVSMTDTIPSWRLGVLLNGFHRSQGPSNIQWR